MKSTGGGVAASGNGERLSGESRAVSNGVLEGAGTADEPDETREWTFFTDKTTATRPHAHTGSTPLAQKPARRPVTSRPHTQAHTPWVSTHRSPIIHTHTRTERKEK